MNEEVLESLRYWLEEQVKTGIERECEVNAEMAKAEADALRDFEKLRDAVALSEEAKACLLRYCDSRDAREYQRIEYGMKMGAAIVLRLVKEVGVL